MELRIALCQCDIAWEQPARNLARLEPMVAAAEADVVLLPELFATGFTLDPAGVADGAGGAVVTALRRWAARYGYKDQPRDILEHAKKGYHAGRYTCVNLTNCDTIEFRMFRGTLKFNTLLATLQMVDHICDVAIYLSDDELRDLSWSSFVSGIKEPELIQYLKERNLYVNEPTEAEGEI